MTTHPASAAVDHLTPERWAVANRQLIRKALAEFSHERLLDPAPLDDGRHVVRSDDGTVEYRFAARRFALDHWQVDAGSITRHRHGSELALDALDFFVEFRATLGLSAEILPVYLEEISSTLAGTAYKLTKEPTTSAQLAVAGFQAVETGMTEGHPALSPTTVSSASEWANTAPTPPRPRPESGCSGWRPAVIAPPSRRVPGWTTPPLSPKSSARRPSAGSPGR